ncbi:hypothetical protein NL108_017171 [Boleophthalmus pectinirostris]|nr:hypothetical protein NL108_017171 [Boleophthalmus pectinirostris]
MSRFMTLWRENLRIMWTITTMMESHRVLWDASKAVLRGKLIMWSSLKKKEKESSIKNMLDKLKLLEIKHMQNKDSATLKKIEETKQVLNKLYEDQIEKKFKFMKQKYYENGPKSKKLLAWRICKQQADRFVNEVRSPVSNSRCRELKYIQKSFVVYHEHLYAQPHPQSPQAINYFLSKLDLPSIGTEQNDRLNREITEEEMNKASLR